MDYTYDIVMLVVLFGAMLFGYAKGLVWQIASVAAVVVSYMLAVRFGEQAAQFVKAAPPFDYIGGMLIVFIGCSLVIWLTYAYVNKSLERAELDGFNRQMGALVGAVLGVLLCMVITMFSVSLLGKTAHDSIFQSRFGPYVIRGISMVHAFVPEELDASLDSHFEKFYQQIGYNPGQTPTADPTFRGLPTGVVVGGSQYSPRQTFNSGNQTSYQGNWSQADQPTQNPYQNSGYQNSGYQNSGYQNSGYPNNSYLPSTGQTQTGYPPAQTNQGTYVPPQQPQQQPQSSGLPPIQLKLDTETLLNGAGQLLKDRFTNPNGGNN